MDGWVRIDGNNQDIALVRAFCEKMPVAKMH